MGSITKKLPQLIFSAFKGLGPIFLITLVGTVLLGALFVYDRIKTTQDRNLAAELSQNLDVKSDCSTKLLGQNEQFTFKFTFQNGNDQPMFLENLGVSLDLLGVEERKFTSFIGSSPFSNKTVLENGFQLFDFESPIEIRGGDTTTLSLTMQTSSRSQAKANPNTIVIYEGEVRFFLSPEFTNTGNCKIQVRYPI